MNASLHSLAWRRTVGVVLATTVGSILGTSLFYEWWSWAGVPTMKPRFADLRMITSTADCVIQGRWTIYSTTCDPFGREYNYPPIWAHAFARVGIGEQSAVTAGLVLGLAVILLFGIFVFIVSQRAGMVHVLAVTVCSISPPTALLLERGNTDIVIILLITLAAVTIRKQSWISGVFAGLATGLKAFPGLIALVFLRKRTTLRDLGILVGIAVVLLEPYVAILRIASREPPYTRDYSFGASSSLAIFFPDILDAERSVLILPLNVLITVGLAQILLRLGRNQLLAASKELLDRGLSGVLFQFASLAFTGAYLTGTKHDYSLVFLVLVSAAIGLSNSRRPMLLGLQVLHCLSMWTAFTSEGRSAVSDLAVSVAVFAQLALVFAMNSRASRSQTI